MKVLLRTPVSPFSGYGNDGIGLALSLLRWGVDLYLEPMGLQPPLPAPVADLLKKELRGPFDLSITHADPGIIELPIAARRNSEYAVGWTMWEYSTFENLKAGDRKTLKRRISPFDLMLGYDPVSVEALSDYTAAVQLGMVPGGYWPDDWPAVERDWHNGPFRFCMVGQLHERKAPFVTIMAFKALKDRYPEEFADAELHLKTNIPGLVPEMANWCPKLKVHQRTWPTALLREFYGGCHVLCAPSIGEGKNMPALEFQSTGGVVIATDRGGHSTWMGPAWSYGVKYELVAEPRTERCYSARADVEHMADLMWHVYTHRDEVKRKGALAATTIPAMCSWDKVIEGLFREIDRRPGGHVTYSKATMARRPTAA